jgi:hypothetical protein
MNKKSRKIYLNFKNLNFYFFVKILNFIFFKIDEINKKFLKGRFYFKKNKFF